MEEQKEMDLVPIPDSLINDYPSPNNPDSEPKKDHSKIQEKPPEKAVSLRAWLELVGWKKNPFIFNITPELLVGYRRQIEKIERALEEKHKIVMVVGPTGSGKTTLLKRISENPNYSFIFIGKPPKSPEEFVDIFNEKFKIRPPKSWFIPNIKNLYQLPDYINKRFRDKHIVILFDEAHEANFDVMEWLRVLADQIEKITIIAAALPVMDEKLRNLETFRKRIAVRIELLSLTKEETEEMIRKRIASAGGADLVPFDRKAVLKIYEKTGGFPREIIRICNDLVDRAMEKGARYIDEEMLEMKIEEPTSGILDSLTPMQKEIIEMLGKKPMDPGSIADHLNLKKYKSRQHAVRSVNNILKILAENNFVVRERLGRVYVYKLRSAVKTMIIKA